MVVGGKGTNPKTTLYVGGLEESVNEAILHSAFIPFGDIKDVNIPMDHATGKHRGFGFVEFESKEVRWPHFWRAWHGKQEIFWLSSWASAAAHTKELWSCKTIYWEARLLCRTLQTPLTTCTTPSCTGGCCGQTMRSR